MRFGWIGSIAACAVVVASLAGCDAGHLLGPGAAQGIEGIVQLGPQCPVQTVENPCPDVPYQAWITVRTATGERVTRIRSDSSGQFRVGLAPGGYVLEPESGNPFPIAGPQQAQVAEGEFTRVTISFDTGIR